MANDKINEYLFERNSGTILGTEYLDLDATNDLGATYVSNKLTINNLLLYINNNVQNIYNGNGILQSERTIVSPNLGITLDAGDITIEMNNEVTDHAFLINDSGSTEKGRFGFDQFTQSGIFQLSNFAVGIWLDANNEQLAVNTDTLFVNSSQVGIGTNSPTVNTKFVIQSDGNTLGTFSQRIFNSDSKLMFEQTDLGNTYIGTSGLGRVGGASFTVGVGASNDGVNFWGGRPASAPAVVGDNISLNYSLTNSAGNPESHSTIFHYVKNVGVGTAYSRQVINGGLHTEQQTSTTSRTLIANQPDFFGAIAGVCHIRNSDVASTTVACLIDSIRQDNLASALIVRSGVASGDFNWNLRTDHFFTHNIAQLSTGDFTLRSSADVSAFVMDASSGNTGFGILIPLEKIHSVAKIRADDAFNLNGNDGITEVLNFNGTDTGDVLTMTIEGGIITGRTLVV